MLKLWSSLLLRALPLLPLIVWTLALSQAANVLLSSSDQDRRGFVAKVSDFGLSRVLAGNRKEIKTQTFGTVCSARRGSQGQQEIRRGAWSFLDLQACIPCFIASAISSWPLVLHLHASFLPELLC